ncbi:hypothetical protein VKT23_003875 [Stygiomarasmius scandens]|uniref:Uncharacterized protein n=1 Tax=Marasmiellus scandens TaxID=2682957 RepID=A0ABR1K2G6_9AGAR
MENAHLSSQIADSFAQFSKEIHRTLEEAERKAQQDIARSVADALEARNERDNSNRLLHEAQMEIQQWKQEVVSLNAQLKQAETTTAHHLETIALLKRECNQWRDQSKNWQDHFLRVEQERCGLASKVEELNDKLHIQNQFTMGQAPLTPVSRYADHDVDDPPSTLPLSPSEPDTPSATRVKDGPPRTSTKKTPNPRTLTARSQPSSSKRSHAESFEDDAVPHAPVRKSLSTTTPRRPRDEDEEDETRASASHSAVPQSRLIRRVTAVVPVKQEEFEEEESIENSLVEEEEEEEEVEDEGDADYTEPEPKRRITKARSSKQSAKTIREPSEETSPAESEEDDELMITSQDQFQKSHTTPSHKRRPPTPGPAIPTAKRRKNNTAPKTGTKKRT